jgi:sulfopyruvate decarboxylase TPP-binding subunit
MTPANAAIVADLLKAAGFDFVATLPATQVHALQSALIADPAFRHAAVSNEGEGAAICAGAWLGGRTPFMVIETSGILVATYALLRCHATFGIPTMILSTYRGELGEQEWYAVHTGAALPGLLAAMRIPSRVVSEVDDLRSSLVEARRSMDTSLHPVSIVMSGRITKG